MPLSTPRPPQPRRDQHESELDPRLINYASLLRRYADTLIDVLTRPTVMWWVGRATRINRSNRTVSVSVDPLPDGVTLGEVSCHWGRPNWNASEIVGKRVSIKIIIGGNARIPNDRQIIIDDVLT